MANWIEVSAVRVLVVPGDEFRRDFKRVDINGDLARDGAYEYRIVRLKDSAVFKQAQFVPADYTSTSYYYLERI